MLRASNKTFYAVHTGDSVAVFRRRTEAMDLFVDIVKERLDSEDEATSIGDISVVEVSAEDDGKQWRLTSVDESALIKRFLCRS